MYDIVHEPIFTEHEIKKIEDFYSKKDQTNVKYICTSSTEHEVLFGDIFYSETIHPIFGNRYFRLIVEPLSSKLLIGNADWIEDVNFNMISHDEKLYYSRGRHDYKPINDISFIDGGRSYTRCAQNDEIIHLIVKNGIFIEKEI